MGIFRGLGGASAIFAASFALHIVGGATDQRWLFWTAVALIYATAILFPAIAARLSGLPHGSERKALLLLSVPLGAFFLGGAFWAANGRTFAWWIAPLALAAQVLPSLVAGTRSTGPLRFAPGRDENAAYGPGYLGGAGTTGGTGAGGGGSLE